MAEGVVILFLTKLCELIEKEAHLLGGVSHDVRLLREKLQWISLSLKEADNRCLEDEGVKLWVAQVRATAFEAEDIIDSFLLKVGLPRRRAGYKGLVGNPIKRWIALHKTGKEIKKINSRLDNISVNRSILGLGNIYEKVPSIRARKERRAPRVEEVDVVGLKAEAEEVCKILIEGGEHRPIVSIVGMGGSGKTTLAKKVFKDIHLRRHFECFAWIYVSQEYIVHDLLCDMVKCFKTLSSDDIVELKSMSEEELSGELFKCLKGRHYLIVIDDIWSREAWDAIEASFPTENNGSRIMLTTRKKDVALRADPKRKPYEVRLLTDEECWELLHKKAFLGVANHGDLKELEAVGKDIAKRCCGLPLAVVVLGGLLSRKDQSIHEWEKVRRSIGWHLKEGEDQILHILALSYTDLPYYLKMCFLCFAAFPEDSSIHATELCRMWVAEGFVQERGDETMEDVAEDYLLELIHRSLVQVVERCSNGRVKRCGIHDLLRDLAITKAKECQFLDVYSGNVRSASPTTERRLSITHGDICKHMSVNHLTRQLRSLFCFFQFDAPFGKENWNNLYKSFKLLRVMQLDNVPISTIPDGIGDLIYLRYLSVKFVGLEPMLTLPSTVNNLCNLQTLVILGVRILLPVDHGIWKMRQLRHLHIRPWCSTKETDMKLNELTNLRTLSLMTVDHWIMGDFDKLTSLRSVGLRGELNLYQNELSSFIGKQENLESLQLTGPRNDQLSTQIISSHLHHLEKLHLRGQLEKLPALQDIAPCLTKLVLFDSRLPEDPMAVLEKLPKLQLLRLLNGSYLGKKMCCSSQGFPVLAILEINWCEELEEWIVEEGAISNLRRMEIYECSKLKMIPEGFQHVTTLQELIVSRQPREFLERVQENGLDWFKIQHVPSVVIKI
ncbi:hypothetical protein AAC387_Pa07g1462 [Persea americana]